MFIVSCDIPLHTFCVTGNEKHFRMHSFEEQRQVSVFPIKSFSLLMCCLNYGLVASLHPFCHCLHRIDIIFATAVYSLERAARTKKWI